MSDSIKKTVIHISGCHLGTTFPEDDFNKDVIGMDDLERFLQEENCLTLYAIIEEKDLNKKIKFFREAEEKDYSRLVIFCKLKPGTITEENLLSSTQVSSITGSPTLALYYSLSNVFTPLLHKEQQQMLQKHIFNMQADLRSTIFADNSDFMQHSNVANSLMVVNSLEHEVEYWNLAISSTAKRDKLTKVACASFRDILTPLSRDFCVLDALSFLEVEDVLEKAHNVLDDLWRHEPPFPKERIKNLMDVIAMELCKFVSKQMEKIDFWNDDFNEVTETVPQLANIGDKWTTTCKQLTEIFWPNYSGNMWRENIYVPQELASYIQILREALNIRTVHKQLIRLLTPEEQEDLKTKEMFTPFRELNIFKYREIMPNSLLVAHKQFEVLLQPAEKRVAMKLKKQLSTLNANTRQLLYEFSRYAEIITRPILKQTLLPERQYLLTALYEYIRTLQPKSNLDHINVSNGSETSQIVKEIVMVRQLDTRVKEVDRVSSKILDDLQGYENIRQQVNELIQDLKQQHTELFRVWSSEVMTLINDNTLSLKESDPVVQFSQKKYMKVNYSSRFVMLTTEVRQLRTMGFHIPSQIEQTCDHAKKFMKHARILEQIANFHNTIGDRMIPSLKPLMLTSALELSKLVQEQEVVSWGDEPSVEKYVSYLKKAVEKLSRENNLLTMYHNQILEKIEELTDVDLIKDYSKWKENTRIIRSIVSQVEDKGFKNMQLWKNDLDKNLCVKLEKQYIKSLDTVHLYLPEIYVDLVYRTGQMNFSPDESNLKKQYDQQLKKFLELPKHYRGISDSSDIGIYAEIIDRNKEALNVVAKHTDELFIQMQSVKTHWQSWIQLENLDTSKLKTWQHWDLHFRSSKIFGQEVAKLPSNEERLGCFIVGLSRLRSDLESHNRSYWDQLVCSLKDSIAQDVVKLQNFVDPSTAALTKQAVTVEELADSGISHRQIMKEVSEMQEVFDEMIKKSQTLSGWSREQVDSVNRLKGAWERLLSLISSHHLIIEKQTENIKMTLNIETENLTKELEHFSAKWDLSKCHQSMEDISDNSIEHLGKLLTEMKTKRAEWSEILSKREKLVSDYNRFNIDQPDVALFNQIEEDLNKDENNWTIFEEFYKELTALTNEFWIVFRKKIYIFEDFLSKWENNLKYVDNTELVGLLLKEIEKYKEIFPLLKYVRGEDFSDKHWMDIFNLLQMSAKPTDQIILNDFLIASENIKSHVKELQAISKKAASEIVVRQALTELDQWEVQARFVLNEHVDSHNKPILLVKEFKEILNKIGDNQSLLQSVKNSSDYGAFADKTIMWENKLTDLEYYVTSLAQVQRKWLYLEPIFSSGTLAHEKQRFDRIDRDVKHISNFIDKDNRVGALCRFPNLRSLLETILDQLARCQNSLNNFLSEKRNTFPRFYFLSDEDLLEIVGQSSKEHVIQTHLKKLFAGINSIQLEDNKIVALCSSEGEVVKLTSSINIQQPVEEWLEVLSKQMQITLKELLVTCQNEKEAPDPLKYPSQILCLSDNITFTLKCEQAISSMTLPSLLTKYKTQLSHYSSLELYGGDDATLASLSDDDNKTLLEVKLKALLLDTIHHINVLEDLIDARTTRSTDWAWQKQLRYYSNSMGEITVKMANARMEYSYEYLGNASKLVRTPLTDRCFLTLAQGMYLGMGGNPYGPAGTGKTESVKALGQLLGRQVLVFNCDEGIDAASMGRIISGLVRSGAWGCFDEFNRLEEATLSAVSMLIQPVQIALRNNYTKINLLDQEISVNKHCGIFVTLNPAGGGYGGRNKLPDNLKQLFRPVVMTHPDHEEIARSLLHCDGYQNAYLLATKIIEVFDLSSKLVSKQQHYDWGLRAIRTILIGCGRSLKRHKLKSEKTDGVGTDVELKLVVEVLRMNTLSKLTFSDSVKFDSIIKDVFKGAELNMQYGNEVLVKALEECFEEMGLEVNRRQINKCLEFYEQLKQRMGVAIVGPPSCGKSTIRKLLFNALVKMKKVLNDYAFNPKCMKRSQLLGYIDTDTKQWNDGVLTNYSLQVSSDSQDVWSWIICDGDIDPDWIESLNSVLDDNRLLTLPSGWRIQFGHNVNFIFESHNLKHASPATISRMGIVFLSEEDLDVTLVIKKCLKTIAEDDKPILEPLIQDYFIKAVNWIVNDGEVTIPCSKIALTLTGLTFVKESKSKAQFSVALVNGLGQHLQNEYKEMFAKQIFDWMGEPEPPLPLKCRYNVDRDIIDTYNSNPNTVIDDISNGLPLVLTGQVAQTLDSLRFWLREGKEEHFLMVGSHGSAKTLILEYLVQERSNAEILTIHCSSNLTPSYVINKLSQHCIAINTHKGKLFKPKRGYLVLYLKNLHLLKHDKWETNILVEFLNQIIVYKGFFDVNIEFIRLENIVFVGGLSQTNSLSLRFTSNVHYYNVNFAEQEDYLIILTAYLSGLLKTAFPSTPWPKTKINKLSMTLIEIYEKIKKSYSPILHKHYAFSPHDITNWCTSILRYCSEGVEDLENFILEIVSYEALHLFGDKLINKEDRTQLVKIIQDSIQSNWGKTNILDKFNECCYVPTSQVTSINYTLQLNKMKKDDWKKLVEQGIIQCEREGLIMDMMVNEELLDLTLSISKVLSSLGENAVLVGRTGIGRRTALKIVAALLSAKLIVPSSENQIQLHMDLKMAIQMAGLEGEQVYLQIEDYILSSDYNIDIINMLISSGEIPGLYTSTEIDSLVKNLKDEADRLNFDGSLLDFFNKRIRSNLHIVVCLDSSNTNLWQIIEQCPVLVQNSTIIWRNDWSMNSINQLPKMIIDRSNQDNVNETKCSPDFLKIYKNVSRMIPEPSRFVSMIKLYITIYQDKVSAIISKQNKLKAGISKLKDAKQLVDELKLKADEQQKKLSEKQSKANSALDMISNTMKNANNKKEIMEDLKQKIEEENIQLIKRKKEIEEELSEVEPLVQEARSAVGNIKSESLSEIRSMRAPPDIIRDILEGVLRLMGIQDTSWNSMKTFLAKRGVKEEIRSFNASRITTESRVSVERLMANKSESFDSKAAKRASLAAAPLAAWVTANVKYSHVMDKIRPLEREQNKLQKNLEDAELQLEELSSGLSDVDVAVMKLKEQLSAYTKEAAEIEIDLNQAKETLNAAEGLVSKLNDEFERWQIQYTELSVQLEKLPSNCLLASAFITYLTKESENQRQNSLNEWMMEVELKDFNFETFLSTEKEHLQWQSQGLPFDKLSMQNAISILKSSMVPLIIDPTSTAINWLKKHINQKNIEYSTQNSAKFNSNLELAIRFGKTLVLEEMECVPTVLHPILRGEFSQQGERKLIKLNGKLIDYNVNFRLILCSRNEHLQITADVAPLINLFNFTVTSEGLTDQLLFAAIKQENPDLENRRNMLLSERETLQNKQEHYQNQLLEDLATSSGDILQNKSLIKSLNETKASSSAITVALSESLELQKKLQQEYDAYKEISSFGSTLYFSCNEFSKSSILYLISVSAFTRLFLKSLESLQVIERKVESQIRSLFSTVYNYMARGIFKLDRLKFILHLAHRLFPRDIPEPEWNVYLNNRVSNNKQTSDEIPSWIPKQSAPNVQNLMIGLPDFYSSLKLNESHLWGNFMSSNEGETNFPTHITLSEFQKILIIQALRPDRLYSTMTTCILNITGLKSLDPHNFELSHILKESICSEPILVLSMPGTDPSTEIKDLAQYTIGNGNYLEVAMGEGQEINALKALQDTSQSGKWLILKNLHLATSWLPILCQTLKDLQKHEHFRLWLISEPTNKFSSVLTQNSLKIVYEAPQGLKNNLQRSFLAYGNKYFENLNATSARIFFVICCVQALLQERRKYIPQGWSRYYEFSDTDLSTCIKLVEDLWQTPSPQIQWKFISGLCAETVYGGRIENTDDMKILDVYVRQYFVDEVLSHRWKLFGKINLPNSANYNDYINTILQLPGRDMPSYFGLAENIDRAWENQNSAKLIKELKDLYILKQSPANFDREIFHKGLTPFMNLWKKLNQGYDFIRMTIPPESTRITAVETFVFEEFTFALNFIQTIHKCFSNLNKVCKGVIAPTKTDIIIGSSLLNYETPNNWMNIWNGPKEPMQYLRTIIRNLIFLSNVKDDDISKILQNPLNLSLFFNPRGLLASHKQDVSRTSNIAIDQLHLQTNWRRADGSGIILNDILVEGAIFEGAILKPCSPTSENISAAPPCYLNWKPKDINEDDKYISVPLYTRSDREDHLIYLNIYDEGKERDKWILCSLSFFLER